MFNFKPEAMHIFLLKYKRSPALTHMGQIPKDGKNDQNVFFLSSTVTKPFDLFNCFEEIVSVTF